MIVIAIIGILAAVAIPMYSDYTKKSRTSEVATNLKEVVKMQILWKEDPNMGGKTDAAWATALASIGFKTSKGTYTASSASGCTTAATADGKTAGNYACGSFYGYTTSTETQVCTGTPAATALAYAEAIDTKQVPNGGVLDGADSWAKACMDRGFNLHHQ
jgi:Tfp pilus assembly protein PilE